MASPRVPSSADIVREAARAIGIEALDAVSVRAAFNRLLGELGHTTLAIYERYEHAALSRALPQRVLDGNPDKVKEAEQASDVQGYKSSVVSLLADLYLDLRREFLSIGQSRKSRGGRSFEDQFALLLTAAGFPYDRQNRRYRTDFVLPSDGAFDRNRTVCAVASLKRTLRERWREVSGELKEIRAPNIYLVTADEDVTDDHVRGICNENLLHLVVWDAVKQRFAAHPLVMGFTELATERLPQLQQQWQGAGLE